MVRKIIESPYMELAIKEAQNAYKDGEVPVGAVIVSSDGDIVSSSRNKILNFKDPTAHAEILAIKEACEKVGNERLIECDMYVTLEPCPMCATAISFARIKNLYYGASDKKGGGVENGPRIFSSSSCHHKPEIYGNLYQEECGNLLKKFFRERR